MSGFGTLATLALVYGKVVLSVAAGITEFCDIDLWEEQKLTLGIQ